MKVHLIRHADAEQRSSWSQPDRARPLSATGRAQALQLSELDVTAGTPVVSSPAVRCVGTVVPLASRLSCEPIVDDRLAEGADPHAVVEWITTSHHDELVLCGHGDLLPEVLRLFAMRGMTLDGPNSCQKGSVWTCSLEDGVPLHATYRPPLTL